MLRIHFNDADLSRTRIAAAPDPLWEICMSLHRFQSRQGRWAHAEWHRTARTRLHATGFSHTVRTFLLPLVPRAVYFPDFLTPPEGAEGLDTGLEAILRTPRRRVLHEMSILDRTSGAPAWAARLAEPDMRKQLVRALRAYYNTVIAPYGDRIEARVEAERAARARAVVDHGTEGILRSLGPGLRWRRPVLHTDYPEDRDLYLSGRGLLLVPSYFCWGNPVTFGDTTLAPVLLYPLNHEPHCSALPEDLGSSVPLAALLGRTRAAVLRAVAAGATTGELARTVGVSASSASQHATTLRDAGLIVSHRHTTSVLHTLTPLGASLLRAGTPTSP
ncbi:helix-turn-helix transcriptional regulator [Streptomyces albus]|uniref:ArsR/SmtB family transcription factor n=1 Tax=Streptomyces albus TaxID=1888 RepID=UPI0004C88DAB|nr:helix-turn-helix domain-containing protein [Streptomyces albus]